MRQIIEWIRCIFCNYEYNPKNPFSSPANWSQSKPTTNELQ